MNVLQIFLFFFFFQDNLNGIEVTCLLKVLQKSPMKLPWPNSPMKPSGLGVFFCFGFGAGLSDTF